MQRPEVPFLKRTDTDMTQGGILRHLVSFSAPLMIGYVFQQLYNTVDSVVVGNFVGKEALAAVGSVGPIINTLIGFFLGLAAGASVIVSQYYGARDAKSVHDAVHTTVVMTLVMCVLFTVAGVLMTPWMLRLMKTPSDVFDGAVTYLRIYFYGVAGLMVYNMGAGIMRAVGDSRRPLYFLIFSAAVNTVLDLVFVICFNWGIAGVAAATVAAQGLSAVLVLIVLTRSEGSYKIIWRFLRIDREMLKKIWRIGLPSALQQAVTSFSNVFVQAYINNFGSACMAGWTSYAKIDQFALIPVQALGLAATTFMGQNLGAGDIKRAKEGTRLALVLSLAVTAVLIVPLMAFPRPLVAMFNDETDVLSYGVLFVRVISPFYLLCVINTIYAGALRGAGDTRVPMYIMLGSFVVFRQVYLFIVSRLTDSEVAVVMGYPGGWLLCSVLIYVYYKTSKWEKKRIVAGKSNSVQGET